MSSRPWLSVPISETEDRSTRQFARSPRERPSGAIGHIGHAQHWTTWICFDPASLSKTSTEGSSIG